MPTAKIARAEVAQLRQQTQYTCCATSIAAALRAHGKNVSEEDVNRVLDASPMAGASWEAMLATVQYFGCRGTLVVPATPRMLKAWTDAGVPVIIAWNPEGRPWSHASTVYDVVEGPDGKLSVHIMDPNIPNPTETTRILGEDEFCQKWGEKVSESLIMRRPAMAVEREVTTEGRQVTASTRTASSRRVGNRMYPADMVRDLQKFRMSKPHLVDEPKGSDGYPSSGYGKGPGIPGTYVTTSPEQAKKWEDLGWVKIVTTATYYNVEFIREDFFTSRYLVALCDLTDEGARIQQTPVRELMQGARSSKLSPELRARAEVLEDILVDGKLASEDLDSIENILNRSYYKGTDGWQPWLSWVVQRAKPSEWKALFEYPTGIDGDLRDFVELYAKVRDRFPRELVDSLRKGPTSPHGIYALRTIAFGLFRYSFPDPDLKRALKVDDGPVFRGVNQNEIETLRTLALRAFPSEITTPLRRVIDPHSVPSTAPKTVVDSALAEKFAILDQLIASGFPQARDVAREVKSVYEAGEKPTEDQLKALRNMLYRSRMKAEADNFRIASSDFESAWWGDDVTAHTAKVKDTDKRKKEDANPRPRRGPEFIEEVRRHPGSGAHQTREDDFESGRGRRQKHKKDWTEREAMSLEEAWGQTWSEE